LDCFVEDLTKADLWIVAEKEEHWRTVSTLVECFAQSKIVEEAKTSVVAAEAEDLLRIEAVGAVDEAEIAEVAESAFGSYRRPSFSECR